MDLKNKAALVLLRGIIWGMAGGLFGVVFLGVLGHAEAVGQGALWQLPAAASAAGAFVGAFYSAKRVALVGATVGSLASIAYLVSAPVPPATGLPVFGVSALAGLAVGGLASVMYEHREAALLVAVAGLAAGALAGLVALGLAPIGMALDRPFSQALIMVPVTGTLFVFLTLSSGETPRVRLPQWLSVGMVAAGIAGIVGLGLWAFSATLATGMNPEVVDLIHATLDKVPGAFAGGMLGGAVGGMVLEILTLHWLGSAAGSPANPSDSGATAGAGHI